MKESDFWLAFIIAGIIAGILFIIKYGFPVGYKVRISLTYGEAKDYFFTKRYCKKCDSQLSRVSQKEFKGRGWSKSITPGDHTYGDS
ncbi:hypothetical protein [Paenibacillus lignilyticus]|uniref:Uncharacterized protein n=1 Tax=Paenibacillus lignilyticus TaxID=1172615 RepID=A0ABS5CAE7_9BACL|nr:hypothetical protein [Paenibacillus lignilyticus]MBP3962790.1 hypothetical protein [Paenibacillus lignilyticus]